MIAWRMAWKDWGFAPALFDQAQQFLRFAENPLQGGSQEGFIRASIVFFLMSFEAFFYELIKGFIQQNRERLAAERPKDLAKVEKQIKGTTGICDAVKDWPKLLTDGSLNPDAEAYRDFRKLTKYRNSLMHGNISEEIPGWAKLLAQDVETVRSAELARRTVSAMLEMVSSHFGVPPPDWT